jgi:hypothetical protein
VVALVVADQIRALVEVEHQVKVMLAERLVVMLEEVGAALVLLVLILVGQVLLLQ